MDIRTTISFAELDALVDQAESSPRHRTHLAVSSGTRPGDVIRVVACWMNNSYAQPHRHPEPDRDETLVCVKGRFAVITFDDLGLVTKVDCLETDGNFAVTIPPNTWHTLVCLENGSMFFEVRQGPYARPEPADWAPWAPAEDSLAAPAMLLHLHEEVERLLAA